MEEGRIAKTGRHEELLRRSGLYAELYRCDVADGAETSLQAAPPTRVIEQEPTETGER